MYRVHFLWLFALLFHTGCSTIRYVDIETYNPPSVTFPADVRTVLIVNNAAAQTAIPVASTLPNSRKTVPHATDSVVADFCRKLGRLMATSPCFDDVRLLESPYRSDGYYFADRKLTPSEVDTLCLEHGVDAVVSIDRLMVGLTESAYPVSEYSYAREVGFTVSGTVRISLPGRTTALATVEIADTLYPPDEAYSSDILSDMSLFSVCLSLVVDETVRRAQTDFVPYWDSDVRWYYLASNAHWKEAAAYASSDRWKQANVVWKSLYEQTSEEAWQRKARLASNLALCAEMSGDFSGALHWAQESHRLLTRFLNDDHTDVRLQKQYLTVLNYRLKAETKLCRP